MTKDRAVLLGRFIVTTVLSGMLVSQSLAAEQVQMQNRKYELIPIGKLADDAGLRFFSFIGSVVSGSAQRYVREGVALAFLAHGQDASGDATCAPPVGLMWPGPALAMPILINPLYNVLPVESLSTPVGPIWKKKKSVTVLTKHVPGIWSQALLDFDASNCLRAMKEASAGSRPVFLVGGRVVQVRFTYDDLSQAEINMFLVDDLKFLRTASFAEMLGDSLKQSLPQMLLGK
ncbi:MAG: hypothetical protein ING66_08785 [Rhodocyclaceae bacterium]|nr:hypothetical protein [Rhodocyclaceae bacterium]MCA3061524.1 hypothetical protein [Rhodocyclaceae bacterium]MCA3081543.1 hypothetical protein [Rhodocyclaceae bacterium]